LSSNYRVAVGHGVAFGSLAVITPQPSAGGVKATQRTYGLDGTVHEFGGQYAILKWSMLETETEYTTILTAFGLSSALYSSVTVYIRNQFFAYARYNAIAQRPMIGQEGDWSNYFLRDFEITLTHLEAL
jgi:hypothetical protein